MNNHKSVGWGSALITLVLAACQGSARTTDAPRRSPARGPERDPTAEGVLYPAEYQTRFNNYLSLDRIQNKDQVIRLFANEIAMQGPDSEGKLPFGSILVGEVYKAKRDEQGEVIVSELGRRIRGDLALVAVMQREPEFGQNHPAGLRNGRWEFAAFKPDGTVAGKDLNTCRSCHAPLARRNHVFSIEHLTGQR